MTREIYEFAEFFVAGWRLSFPGRTIPINDGRLDHALYEIKASIPVKFEKILTFGTTRTGFRCYELAEILHAGFNNLLLSAPTPAHTSVDVMIDDETARILLRRRGITPQLAINYAKQAQAAILPS
jgi:transcriptional regulator of met regulon